MARTYSRDSRGRFAGGGGSSAPRGTIAKGGRGTRGSVARSVASTQGQAKPAAGQAPRLKAKKAAQLVMKEGITSKAGSARAGAIKAEAAERKAKKQLSAAKKVKGPQRQQAVSAATQALDKAQNNRRKAMDKLVKATR